MDTKACGEIWWEHYQDQGLGFGCSPTGIGKNRWISLNQSSVRPSTTEPCSRSSWILPSEWWRQRSLTLRRFTCLLTLSLWGRGPCNPSQAEDWLDSHVFSSRPLDDRQSHGSNLNSVLTKWFSISLKNVYHLTNKSPWKYRRHLGLSRILGKRFYRWQH